MLDMVTIVLRLALAAACGGTIGYQRERKDRPAGFRTHILVCLGAALFMMVSIFDFPGIQDPSRVAAQVVTGIGFLGAGTIIRQGNIIIGLTTAASLWAVAAVGLAAGLGYYPAAVLGTLMIFLVLSFFKMLEARIVAVKKTDYRLVIFFEPREFKLSGIPQMLTGLGVDITNLDLTRQPDGHLQVALDIKTPPALNKDIFAETFVSLDGVLRVRVEEVPEPPPLFG